MEGLKNLADLMLVLVVGLMIAIVAFWKVDLSKVVDIIDSQDLVEIENPEEILQDNSDTSQYEQRGIVIEDPETGKLYVIQS